MFKNFSLITLLLFTISCGYEPLHSIKNRVNKSNVSVAKIDFIGDREINIKINERLSSYTNIVKEKHFTLDINSKSLKTIIAKDLKGDPSIFNLSIETIVQFKDENNINGEIILKENFKYSNNADKFELKRYEKEIKRNLAHTITNNLIIKLSNY